MTTFKQVMYDNNNTVKKSEVKKSLRQISKSVCTLENALLFKYCHVLKFPFINVQLLPKVFHSRHHQS